MLTHKKFWVYRSSMGNSKFLPESMHADQSCTSCHGGVDGTPDRATAHGGSFKAVPGATACQGCHPAAAALAASSLHTTLAGYEHVLAGRGMDLAAGTEGRARYDKQCTRCHAATVESTAASAACGQCHVSVPESAGGGLVAGHRFRRTPDQVSNCTACHGSRVKDEYYGGSLTNDALYARNRTYSASLAATDPFGGAPLQPDVHHAAGMTCDACHPASEMHGAGLTAGVDRYGVTGRTQCTSCHASLAGSNGFHTAGHLDRMACQVCHGQPYKNCFSCHTQETAGGVGYFSNNVTDPTRAARRVPAAAWSSATTYAAGAYVTYAAAEYRSLQAGNTNHLPDEPGSTWWVAESAPLPPGDALMTFRAGRNPRFGLEAGAKEFAVLRHVPIDADVFTYTEEGTQVPGLVPALDALPTWKYATPHNIQRVTAITTDPDGAGSQTACGNCHSSRYAGFWLTDPGADAHGWTGGAAFEEAANAGVVQPTPLAPTVVE